MSLELLIGLGLALVAMLAGARFLFKTANSSEDKDAATWLRRAAWLIIVLVVLGGVSLANGYLVDISHPFEGPKADLPSKSAPVRETQLPKFDDVPSSTVNTNEVVEEHQRQLEQFEGKTEKPDTGKNGASD